MNPITEDDIANFLANTPDFFERHAQLLATVQLNSPHGNRAVGLQERQAQMLREKIRALELRLQEMIRHGNENMVIADKMQRWTSELFLATDPFDLPERLCSEMRLQFDLPQVGVKVWGVASTFANEEFALGVSDDAKTFASSLTMPYCGVNLGFESIAWLEDASQAMSVALIPLRAAAAHPVEPAFGMLVLGSPDAQRFHSGMGTEFLERIGEISSAALSRLRRA